MPRPRKSPVPNQDFLAKSRARWHTRVTPLPRGVAGVPVRAQAALAARQAPAAGANGAHVACDLTDAGRITELVQALAPDVKEWLT